MIKFESKDKGFKLYYKEHLVLSHSPGKPCVKIGKGVPKYKEQHGCFSPIKNVSLGEYLLQDFEVKNDTEKQIDLEFKSGQEILKLSVVDTGKILEILPECDNPSINRFTIVLQAKSEEAIYGCGEQFSELNLRGKDVPLWVEEQGIGRGDPKFITFLLNTFGGVGGDWYTTYYPQPTFVSSANYFCHFESSWYGKFNFTKTNCHELTIWGIPKKIQIGKYDTAVETVSTLSEILGRQPKFPEWALENGMWLALQGRKGKEWVEERLKNALEKGVKVGAIWSQDWQGIYVTSFGTQLFWDWKWDGNGREIRFPNFPDFVKEMREKYKVRYIGYINSFLNQGGDMYKEAAEKGYLVKNADGSIHEAIVTSFPVGIIDLTNPEAFSWIKEIMKKNMIEEAGLSGWMSDFGESIQMDAVLHSGISGEEFHNQYPVEWQRANYEALKESGKLGEIVYFTRSGYSHTSKYSTCIWAGDQLPTFSMDDGLASVIPGGLSLGMCGIGYYHSDIGGYTTFKPFFVRKKEVFMRWAEQAAFTILMRTHEGNQPDNNIQFDLDDEVLGHLAKMTQIHVHLAPYLKYISNEYQEKGLPCMRPLYLHYEDDPQCHSIKYEYLFGRDLLIAPVIKKNKAMWKVYLPKDNWIHVWTGKEYAKGWHEIAAPLGKPPVFYRNDADMKALFEKIADI
jgi:sulfoquinovosidase